MPPSDDDATLYRADRRRSTPLGDIVDRLDSIERRLSRIEGGLALGAFAVTIAVALLGSLHL